MGLRAVFIGITSGTLLILTLWYYEMQLLFGVQIATFATLFLYLLIPTIFHFSPFVQRHLVFLPYVRWPNGINLQNPSEEGIVGGRNFYLETEPGFKVGVWHILPRSLKNQAEGKGESFWKESLKNSGRPVVIYYHGNTGSRAGEHRKELYVLLQEQDYHVVSFDYRGYADSTACDPSETGTVTDGAFVYNWVRGIVGKGKGAAPIFIWGHSLGTGVSSHVVSNLCLEGNPPAGLFLEAPFTSLLEEVRYHMLAAIYRILPGFDYIFLSPLREHDMSFESDRHIANIDIPIVIFHATDDPVIPFFLAQKLFKIGYKTRSKLAKPIYFQDFPDGYAHKFICRAPNLAELINEFIGSTLSDTWPCPSLEASSAQLIQETQIERTYESAN